MTCADLPAPNEQALQSVKYVAQPVCCVPTTDPDQWGVFVGGQAKRELVGIMTTDQMLTHLRTGWQDRVVRHNAATQLRNTPAVKVSTAELDDILADLTL